MVVKIDPMNVQVQSGPFSSQFPKIEDAVHHLLGEIQKLNQKLESAQSSIAAINQQIGAMVGLGGSETPTITARLQTLTNGLAEVKQYTDALSGVISFGTKFKYYDASSGETQVKIEADRLTLKSHKDMTLEAGRDVQVEAIRWLGLKSMMNVNINAEHELQVIASTAIKATSMKFEYSGPTFKVNAHMATFSGSDFNVNAPMAAFSDALKCKSVYASFVAANTYTPGKGNIW